MEFQGAKLKKIRLERGISLEEVHKRTKIQLNILKAIEGESLTSLSPVYLKSFLKIYCKFLGVEPQEFVKEYSEPQPKTKTQVERVIKAREFPVRLNKPLEIIRSVSLKFRSFKPSKEAIRIFAIVLAIPFLFVILFNLGKAISSRRKNFPVKAERAQATEQAALPSKPSKPKTPASLPATSSIKLGIRAKENCWVQVRADGVVVFQRVLEKGRLETWVAKDKFELSLGNAGGVELEINGELFSNLGRRGQVLKSIVITKEGLKTGK
jgi:cytoskeletal protein RodZ